MKDKVINPSYYKANGLDSIVVIEAFFQTDAHLASAFKYMVRAGKKTTTTYTEDIMKAQWWLKRAIQFRR